MQSQERELIEGLFSRLKAYESQPRDPEADRLIATIVSAQPGAPYLLTQTVLVQEHALKAAQERIAELEAKAAAAPPPSFLGSAPESVRGARHLQPLRNLSRNPRRRRAVPGNRPRSNRRQGGFLRSAMTTAAGVAGGALLFDGIRSLFGHSSPFGMGSFGSPYGGGGTTIVENNYSSPLPGPDSSAYQGQDDGSASNYNDASASDDSGFGNAGFDDSGFDNSGGSDDSVV